MSSPALSLEATTIHIAEEIAVRASIEVTFAALLDQLGPYNETEVDKPMPMKLEAVAGRQMVSRPGRQQRPLLGNGSGDQEADAAGNLWATVHVQPGDNESSISPEGIGRRDDGYISTSSRLDWCCEEVQKRKEWLGSTCTSECGSERKRRGSAEARTNCRSLEEEICVRHASQAQQ